MQARALPSCARREQASKNACPRVQCMRAACVIALLFLRMHRGAKAKRVRGASSRRRDGEGPANPGYAHCADDCCLTIAVESSSGARRLRTRMMQGGYF